MSRPKGRKRRADQNKVREKMRQAPQTQTRRGGIRLRLQQVVNHRIVPLAGLFATGLAIWQFVIPAFAPPNIEVTGSDPASPFVFPFRIRNPSWLFTAENIRWICHVRHMEVPGNNTLNNITSENRDTLVIGPGKSNNYMCRIMNPGVPVRALSMDVSIEFTTLNFWPRFSTTTFTWVTDGPYSKWIKGTVDRLP